MEQQNAGVSNYTKDAVKNLDNFDQTTLKTS